jgi:hypothetical protein
MYEDFCFLAPLLRLPSLSRPLALNLTLGIGLTVAPREKPLIVAQQTGMR